MRGSVLLHGKRFAGGVKGFCVADYQSMQCSKAEKTRIGFDKSACSRWNQRWCKYSRSYDFTLSIIGDYVNITSAHQEACMDMEME